MYVNAEGVKICETKEDLVELLGPDLAAQLWKPPFPVELVAVTDAGKALGLTVENLERFRDISCADSPSVS